MSHLNKPQLRGLLGSQIKRHAVVIVAAAFVSSAVYYVTVNWKRKQIYRDFYNNYDADKDYLRMREAGVFSSIAPGGTRRTMNWD